MAQVTKTNREPDIDVEELNIVTNINDAAGVDHDGELANASDISSIQSSTDVDHDETSNRTHDGDDLTPDALEASDSIGNATYETLGDVPTDLPKGAQVWVQDENAIYVEDGE